MPCVRMYQITQLRAGRLQKCRRVIALMWQSGRRSGAIDMVVALWPSDKDDAPDHHTGRARISPG
jgi:hypothetical protein